MQLVPAFQVSTQDSMPIFMAGWHISQSEISSIQPSITLSNLSSPITISAIEKNLWLEPLQVLSVLSSHIHSQLSLSGKFLILKPNQSGEEITLKAHLWLSASLRHQDKYGMVWKPTFSDMWHSTWLSQALMTTSKKVCSLDSESTVSLSLLLCCLQLVSQLLWRFLSTIWEQDYASYTNKLIETD